MVVWGIGVQPSSSRIVRSYQGEDDVVPPLDLRDLSNKEAEVGEEKVAQPVLAGFQDALWPSQWRGDGHVCM